MAYYLIRCPQVLAEAKIPYSFVCEHCGQMTTRVFSKHTLAAGQPDIKLQRGWHFDNANIPSIKIRTTVSPSISSPASISFPSDQIALVEQHAINQLPEQYEIVQRFLDERDYSMLKHIGMNFKCAHCNKEQSFVKETARLKSKANPSKGALNAIIISVIAVFGSLSLIFAIGNTEISPLLFLIPAVLILGGFGWLLYRKISGKVRKKVLDQQLERYSKPKIDWQAIEVQTKRLN